jgi:hypothetical protein
MDEVDSIEDPVTGATMSRDAFMMTYGRLVTLLDGTAWDMKPSFWFEAHPLNARAWMFRGDARRSEWVDWAIDEVCIPPIKEMQEGESVDDRTRRFEKEAADARAREIQKSKARAGGGSSIASVSKREAVEANLRALEIKIERVRAAGGDVSALEKKREAGYLLLNKWMDVTM